MGIFNWDVEKNKKLQSERDLSFEEIVYAIEHDQLLAVLQHSDQRKYPGQLLLVVNIEDYAVVVPAVKEADGFFLKTAFPSRQMTRKYLKGDEK